MEEARGGMRWASCGGAQGHTRRRRSASTAAEMPFTTPKTPNPTGASVTAMSTAVYRTIWRAVSQSPFATGSMGTPARA